MPRPSLIGTRVLTGVLGIAVAVSTVSMAALIELPTIQRVPTAVEVTPVPTAKQLVCPGAVLRLGGVGGENASVASAIGQPSYERGSTEGEIESTALQSANAADSTAGASTVLTAAALGEGVSVSIAGAQHQVVDSGDYRGLAAADCTQPSSEAWLVGGSTAVGRTTLLTLANPNPVASTVAIEIFTGDGLVDAPGTTGIVVAARSQRVISLAGFTPGSVALVVHVTSRGGPIAATLQESIVRGIEPGGVDIVGPTAAPSTLTVIPGVRIVGAEAVAERLADEGFDDLLTSLRVFVPGDTAARATVRVVPEDAALAGASFELDLDAGVVTDVPIEGLADGAYSVQIASSVPVTAAVRSSTVAAESVGKTPAGASDVAWFGAATALGEAEFASIAPGPGASLHVSNPGTESVTFTLTTGTGTSTVTVAAGASAAVSVLSGSSYRIVGASGLFASVSFAAPGQLASYLISSAASDEAAVVVYPG